MGGIRDTSPKILPCQVSVIIQYFILRNSRAEQFKNELYRNPRTGNDWLATEDFMIDCYPFHAVISALSQVSARCVLLSKLPNQLNNFR